LQLHLDAFRRRDAALIAVVVDPVEKNAEVVARLGLGFPILADPDLTVVDRYDLRHVGGYPGGADIARPATFVLDAAGIIRWRDLTENYRERPSPTAILAALDALPTRP
jgi:peroxiredoxin